MEAPQSVRLAARSKRLNSMSMLPQFSAATPWANYGRNQEPQPETEPMLRRKALLLVFAAFSVMLAAYAAAKTIPDTLETVSNATVVQDVEVAQEAIKALNIMDDARLRFTCIIGAFGGALISVAMFSTPRFRPMAAKFIVAAISGSMLTPMLMRSAYVPLDTDWSLGSSCLVAILAYSVIQAVAPLVPKAIALLFRQKYMPPEEEENNNIHP